MKTIRKCRESKKKSKVTVKERQSVSRFMSTFRSSLYSVSLLTSITLQVLHSDLKLESIESEKEEVKKMDSQAFEKYCILANFLCSPSNISFDESVRQHQSRISTNLNNSSHPLSHRHEQSQYSFNTTSRKEKKQEENILNKDSIVPYTIDSPKTLNNDKLSNMSLSNLY